MIPNPDFGALSTEKTADMVEALVDSGTPCKEGVFEIIDYLKKMAIKKLLQLGAA